MDVRNILKRWNPIGCLVDRALQNGKAPVRLFGKTPIVFLDQNPRTASDCTTITNDSAATALMAVEELHQRGLKHLAFVFWKNSHFWERERFEAFREYSESNRLKHDTTTLSDDMEQWLRNLPKPCGIVCANDISAQKILSLAMICKISVPDEIAVVGIDNDVQICEHTTPTLTSVAPDFVHAGYRLAELLHRRICNPKARHIHETYNPREIVIRESSMWMACDDPRTRKAIAHIRNHLTDPALDVKSVISTMNCSRTLADRLFQRATGMTMREWQRQHCGVRAGRPG